MLRLFPCLALSLWLALPAARSLAQESKISQADAWIGFEQQRDKKTARAERVFFPLSLALTGALLGGAAAAPGVPTAARIGLGTSAGLAVASMLPTMLAPSRDGRLSWFAAANAVTSLGLGASIVALDLAERHDAHNPSHGGGRWAGAAIGMQALLLFVPIALMKGFPDDSEYEAYWKLSAEARPEAAARLLRRIDEFEEITTALTLMSTIAASTVLAVGSMRVDDHSERVSLGALSAGFLGTSLLFAVPRLFAGSRVDHYAVGGAPKRLGFNLW